MNETDGQPPRPQVPEVVAPPIPLRVAPPTPDPLSRPERREERPWISVLAVIGLLITVAISLLLTHRWPVKETPVKPLVTVAVPPAVVKIAEAAPAAPTPPRAAIKPKALGAPAISKPPSDREASRPERLPGPRDVAVPAYPFDVTTLDGQHFTLAKLRGRTVVITLWVVGCGFCFVEIPELVQVQNNHAHDGTVFLSVAQNTEAELRASPEAMKYPFPIVADPTGHLHGSLGANGTPTHVVIDRKGRVVPGALTSGAGDVATRLEKSIVLARTSPEVMQLGDPDWIDGPCSLHGRATREADGSAVAFASVTLFGGGGNRTVMADTAGRFEMVKIPCGEHQLAVSSNTASLKLQPVKVERHADPEVTVAMPALGAIEGTVVDGEGQPIADAKIAKCAPPGEGETRTDADGHFALSGLVGGEMTWVTVTLLGAEAGAATQVTVKPGETTTVRLQQELATLRGHVESPGQRLQISPKGIWCAGVMAEVAAGTDGSFDALMPPGRYSVRVAGEQKVLREVTLMGGETTEVELRGAPSP